MPKVSVILTSFNHENFIREAIDSVLNQTFTDIELIIWDDASIDKSWDVINSYSDSRIKAFRNEVSRRGIYGINKSISEVASGEYIAIHHSDDVWELDKLEKQVSFLEEHSETGAAFTNVLAIGDDGALLAEESHFYFKIFSQPNRTRHEWLKFFFNHGNALCHPSVLIRKSCYEDCGLYRFGFAQLGDLDMWIRLCLKHEIHVLPEKLVRFRVRDNEANSSGNRPEVRIRGSYETYKLLTNYRQLKNFDDLVKVFPRAEKFFRNNEADTDFVLAMIALEEKPFTFTELFGLELLFEAISDSKRAEKIKQMYDFDYKSFIAVTAKCDVFSLEHLSSYQSNLAEKAQQIQDKGKHIENQAQQIQSLRLKNRIKSLLGLYQAPSVFRKELPNNFTKHFDSKGYLNANPDIVVAIQKGAIESGLVHFYDSGFDDVLRGDRPLLENLPFYNDEDYKLIRTDVTKAIEDGSFKFSHYVHYLLHGHKEILRKNKLEAINSEFNAVSLQGSRKMLKKAYKLYRQDGLEGIKNGFRYLSRRLRDKLKPTIILRNQEDYTKWFRRHGKLLKKAAPDYIKKIGGFEYQPTIAIIVPTYNTNPEWLAACIESVSCQIYPNWRLYLSDDGSESLSLKRILQDHSECDERIVALYGDKNSGVSASINRALAVCEEEFVVLLDHNDVIEPQAIFRFAQVIIDDNPDFIYSDEALISEDGNSVIDFIFRPGFSLEYLRAHPYILHLVGFRTSLLKNVGGFDENLKVSQYYDVILKVAERASSITHIPELLYLWRQHSSELEHKYEDKVMSISTLVLQAHLDRCEELGTVVPDKVFKYFDVRYPVSGESSVAIIIPTKNHADLVRQCIESITLTVHKVNYKIIIIDHDSDDVESKEYFSSLKKAHTVFHYSGEFNFSAINNWAVKQLKGAGFTHYLFCNNDIEAVGEDWLERMLELAEKSDVGVVGSQLYYPGGKQIQHAGVTLGLMGLAEHNGKFMAVNNSDGSFGAAGYRGAFIANHELLAVTAACMLVRSDVFDSVNGYDEKLAVGFGDIDLCLRIHQLGYRIVHCPKAVLVHHESFSRGKSTGDPHPGDTAFFKKRWALLLSFGDPFYNPNFDLFSTNWTYRLPRNEIVRRKSRTTYLNNLRIQPK